MEAVDFVVELPRYMTLADVEETYSLSETDIRKLAATGRLRLYRPTVGRRKVLVSRAELEQIISES
jgi:hypothetical protein